MPLSLNETVNSSCKRILGQFAAIEIIVAILCIATGYRDLYYAEGSWCAGWLMVSAAVAIALKYHVSFNLVVINSMAPFLSMLLIVASVLYADFYKWSRMRPKISEGVLIAFSSFGAIILTIHFAYSVSILIKINKSNSNQEFPDETLVNIEPYFPRTSSIDHALPGHVISDKDDYKKEAYYEQYPIDLEEDEENLPPPPAYSSISVIHHA